jgi:glycosyltransferase involved in cell wall biosynthesis
MAGETNQAPVRVLLIGNYAPDRQESMQRFAQTLAAHLPARGFEVELLRPEPLAARLQSGAHGLGKWLGYVDKFILFPRRLDREVQRARAGGARVVVHICDHSNAVYTRQLRDVPHLVTCNDLLAIRSARGEFPAHRTRWSGRVLQRLILAGLRRARRVTCISHATARDARRLLEHSAATIGVTHMGLNYPYSPMPQSEAQARVQALLGWPEPRPYLIHVGGEQWYKNRRGAVRLFAAVRAELGSRAPQLLLVGSPPADETAALLRADPELARTVHAVGEIDNETLRTCYSAAELLLFPSLQEGFGWPIIEAQACGCRVLTTGKGPMNEVGNAATFYLPPDPLADLPAAVDLLRAALEEPESARARRIAAGLENAGRFSTAKMIDAYARTYRELTSAA